MYLHGLNVAVRGNAQAFGFSILITVSYGIVTASSVGKPSPLELIGFALSAVAAFALMNILVAWLKTIQPRDTERSRVLLMGTATDFLSVGAGLGVVFGAVALLDGWAAWVLAPFLAGWLTLWCRRWRSRWRGKTSTKPTDTLCTDGRLPDSRHVALYGGMGASDVCLADALTGI